MCAGTGLLELEAQETSTAFLPHDARYEGMTKYYVITHEFWGRITTSTTRFEHIVILVSH